MTNQQWPYNPALRGGAWEYHSVWPGPATPNLIVKAGVLTPSDPPGVPLIPAAPTKPIRYWFEMGDQDLFYPNPTIPDGMAYASHKRLMVSIGRMLFRRAA